jgi:uncharacterized repeat protein (TIGR01451 family)
MKRFYSTAGVALLGVCLAGGVALASGQSSPGPAPSEGLPVGGEPDSALREPPPSVPTAGLLQAGGGAQPLPGGTVPELPKPGGSPPAPMIPPYGASPLPPPPPGAVPGTIGAGSAPLPVPSGGPPGPGMLPGGPDPLPGGISSPGMPAPGAPAGMDPLGGPPSNPGLLPAERSVEPLPGDSATGRQEPSISLEWVGPNTAKIGVVSDYTLVVRNTCNIPVQQVLVRVRIPQGLTVNATEPRALVEGNILVWELGTLQPKQDRNLQMKLVADSRGDVMPQAWVTFTGSAVMRVKIREPKLALKIKAPEKVLMGEEANFTLLVSNPGDGPADQVKIHAALSEGLGHPRGNKIDFDVGSLAAGETRNIGLTCSTCAGGTQKMEVTAEAEGGLSGHESAAVSISMPKLDVQVAGPALRYLGRKAIFTLKVSNPGDAPATNVTVSDVVPEGFKVLAASHGGRHDSALRTVSWFLGDVSPGQPREVQLEVQAIGAGEFKHHASAIAARGLKATNELATRVEGLSALMVEMVDLDDPIEVNSETTYEVRITNTGSKAESDIKLVATIPDKMEFKSAQGLPSHAQGKTIVFDAIDRLAPRADAIVRINVKAQEPGTTYFKIQVTSANIVEPILKNEATRIYSDAPDSKAAPPPAAGNQ